MRRTALTLVATVVGLVLLLSYKTHAGTPLLRPAALAPATPGATATDPSAPATPAPTTSAGSGTTTTATKTVDGDPVPTQYGTVQVRVVAKGGRVVNVQPLQLPDTRGLDIEIDNVAVPQLIQETLQAQSAKIDMVSGATYTSAGYIQSLQSALDKL